MAKPLVFLTGTVDHEPDIHAKLIRALDSCQREVDQGKEGLSVTYKEKELLQPIQFQVVPLDYSYIEKKPPKDYINSEGILKTNWPTKHFDSLPSVLLYVVPFGIDWNVNEFSRREVSFLERYNRLRASLASRDIKVIVLAVRVGVGYVEKELVDERTNHLKKYLQIDSRNFFFLTAQEVAEGQPAVKRLHRTLRDYSYAYYSAQVKKFKTLEKGVSERYKGITEYILTARYNFKIAFFYEFTANRSYMLRYYKACYTILVSSMEAIDEEMYEQMQKIAEYVHYKICVLFILLGQYDELVHQFKCHTHNFSKIYLEQPWKHYGWMADQYIIFAQLLQSYNLPSLLSASDAHNNVTLSASGHLVSNILGQSLSLSLSTISDLDISYFYMNAARFTREREVSFEKGRHVQTIAAGVSSSTDAITFQPRTMSEERNIIYKGMVFLPSKYIGSAPQLLDPVLDSLLPGSEEAAKIYKAFLVDQESMVNHHQLIVKYYHITLSHLTNNMARKRGFIYYLLAEQHIKHLQYHSALIYLWHALGLFHQEKWWDVVTQTLRLIIHCCTLLGRATEYVYASLLRYSLHDSLSRYEKEDLHLNIMAFIFNTLNKFKSVQPREITSEHPLEEQQSEMEFEIDLMKDSSGLVRNPDTFITTSFIPIYCKSNYGEFANDDESGLEVKIDGLGDDLVVLDNIVHTGHGNHLQPSQVLERDTVFHFPNKSLFTVKVFYDKTTVELGQELTVSICVESHFIDSLVLSKIQIDFNDGILSKIFLHTADEGKVEETLKSVQPQYANLELHPQRVKILSFSFLLTEDVFGKLLQADSVFFCHEVSFVFANSNEEVGEEEEEEGVEEEEEVANQRKGCNSITFTIANVPGSIRSFLNTQQSMIHSGPQKHKLSMKDLFQYHELEEKVHFVTILRPTNLIDLVSPKHPVHLYHNLLQRVDIILKVGKYPICASKIFLSSNMVMLSNYPSLFWMPSIDLIRRLQGITGDSENILDFLQQDGVESRNQVLFHPFAVNASFQPCAPLYIPSVLPAGSTFCVPLFLCCKQPEVSQLEVKLTCEFVPQDIMHSPITRDFIVKVNVSPAFGTQVTYSNGYDLMNDPALGVTKLLYPNNLNVLGLDLKYNNPAEQVAPIKIWSQEMGGFDKNYIELMRKSPIGCVVLQPQEVRRINFPFKCKSPPFDSVIKSSIAMGRAIVAWRLRDHHPLIFSSDASKLHMCSPFPASHPLRYLLLPHPCANVYDNLRGVETEFANVMDDSVEAHDLAQLVVPIPDFTFSKQDLAVMIDAPHQVAQGQPFTITVQIENTLASLERAGIVAFLNEAFLLAGPTSSVVEVPGRSKEVIRLTAVALRPGMQHIPQLRVIWERWGNSLVDLGDKESARRPIFVEPAVIHRTICGV
eukprot:scaffold1365_cov163-Ochromonas_danica.AAC.57